MFITLPSIALFRGIYSYSIIAVFFTDDIEKTNVSSRAKSDGLDRDITNTVNTYGLEAQSQNRCPASCMLVKFSINC